MKYQINQTLNRNSIKDLILDKNSIILKISRAEKAYSNYQPI